jgi:hypothetical protein
MDKVLAYPVDKDGSRIGPAKEIPKDQWERMLSLEGPPLRWVLVERKENLERMTKSQLIDKFQLHEDDMRLTKSEIINKIVK